MDLSESTTISEVPKNIKKTSELWGKNLSDVPGISQQYICTLSLTQKLFKPGNNYYHFPCEQKLARAASVLSFKLPGFFILFPENKEYSRLKTPG